MQTLAKPGEYPSRAESVEGWLEEIGLVRRPLLLRLMRAHSSDPAHALAEQVQAELPREGVDRPDAAA